MLLPRRTCTPVKASLFQGQGTAAPDASDGPGLSIDRSAVTGAFLLLESEKLQQQSHSHVELLERPASLNWAALPGRGG